MHLDWWTLALQTVNFLVLVWLLWRFLYRPVRQVLEKRKRLADAAVREAEASAQAADSERARLEVERATLADERQAMLKEMHDERERERTEIRQAAEREAAAIAAEARAALADEREAAVAASRNEVIALATDVAATLLRQADDEGLYDVTLDRIDRHLADLKAEDRKSLLDDLSRNGHKVQVLTAVPLDADAQRRWRERLGSHLGDGAVMAFDTDAALVGGAELHFPHARLCFSWADRLEKAKQLLAGHDNAS